MSGRLAAFEFARWRAAVVGAADGLLGGEWLTAAGRRFVVALRDEVRPWLEEAVEPVVGRLAEGANADHRARWRLRNLTVAEGDAEALARAWRAGTAPPRVGAPRVRAGAGRLLERGARLDLTHRFLREGDQKLRAGGRVRPGDVAYLGGRHGTAARAYGRDLEAIDDLELWAGLAIVSPHAALRERPELVRAAYLALRRSGDADLHALAAWMAQVGGGASD